MNERIKKLRKELGLSQEEFGNKLGISGPSVSKIESGVNNPSESTLKLICTTYHVYYLWLTTGQGPIFEDDDQSRIDRIVEKAMPNADPYFKAQVKMYASLMTDEDWIIFRDIVEQVRNANKEE